jgi:hypothetical protein
MSFVSIPKSANETRVKRKKPLPSALICRINPRNISVQWDGWPDQLPGARRVPFNNTSKVLQPKHLHLTNITAWRAEGTRKGENLVRWYKQVWKQILFLRLSTL